MGQRLSETLNVRPNPPFPWYSSKSMSNKTALSVAMALDLIDKQAIEFAEATFSPEVQNVS